MDVLKFEKKIGIEFKNKDLLKQAFTHRSYLNERPSWPIPHNERLEFLGDAVLELIVTEYLYVKYPEKTEGELTSYRAALVNAQMLSRIASDLEINEHLFLSRGEAKDIGRARQYILANTFESLVGALYLDQGYDKTRTFIEENLFSYLKEVLEKGLWQDSKSLFQEKAQELVNITPTYEVLEEWGPDHDKHFIVGVFLNKELVAQGEGPSKQIAQQQAAQVALKAKSWD